MVKRISNTYMSVVKKADILVSHSHRPILLDVSIKNADNKRNNSNLNKEKADRDSLLHAVWGTTDSKQHEVRALLPKGQVSR